MIVVVMGVSGAGKTTVGRALADRLSWSFLEGDDLHPPTNIAKMAKGIPLNDDDRWPWLDAIASVIESWASSGRSGVISCSALRWVYRDHLATAAPSVRFIYLELPISTALERLRTRRGHFMPTTLLESQYETLEPITEAEQERTITLDATQEPAKLVEQAVQQLDTDTVR